MPGGPADAYGDNALGGVYFAIVTQNTDEDGPGGRVRVRYPWMPAGDKDQSFWAPICVPMIGGEFGTYVLPEVNDEVLVMFEAGAIHRPIVIGGGWSTVDTPPETNDNGKNEFKVIKTRGGHRLIFDDSGKTKVVVADPENNHVLGVGAFKKEGSSPNAVEVPALGSDKGIAAAAKTGNLKVWCPDGKLMIDGKTVDISSTEGADVKGGSDAKFAGKSDATIAGAQAAKINGSPLKVGP